MARRLIESATPQVKVSTDLVFRVKDLFGDGDLNPDMGKNWVHYEYEAHMNQPEIVQITVLDPHHTIFDEHMEKYFKKAIPFPPIMMMTQGRWVPANAGNKLELTKKEHAITSMKSIGPIDEGADQNYRTFTGMSLPHYLLEAGDAGGYVYKGKISDVLHQVCSKYSRGLIKCLVKTNTKDDKHNKWWQNRMDPMSFIKSLLRWSTSLTKGKTRWMFCADTDENMRTIEFFEQIAADSLHRATYWWGGDPSRPGHGDIVSYRMVGDNTCDARRGKIVTSGISTLSGAYHDRIVHWKNKDVVYVDEKQTGNKFRQKPTEKGSYTQPSTDEPLKEAIGWTRAHSLPEPAAGEIGMKYEDYIDGYARGEYYRDSVHLERVEFKVLGHHIWSESIGLGSDTIDIMWRTPRMQPHYLHGVWIVDGFKHVIAKEGWHTYLYCHRMYANAVGKKVGKFEKLDA